MADDNNDISVDGESQGGGKKKLIIMIVALLLLLGGGGAGAYFFLFSDNESVETEAITEEVSTEIDETLQAIYVAMPRPFVFNVMEGKRDRLVQIKVQLMVRGDENQTLAKKHIPLLEGTLVRIFGAATVGQLRSPEGKEELRKFALEALNKETMKVEDKGLINAVLFTGFVLQ
ncbi:flagellar basal body-associated protein FliL [Psychromonas sp. CNPT3]|uniref:flagellar basal body-associated protein FliL n=1 Tax=Psychromonas sp. CNPT3 TaxID=314282 RepID=UPI00006E78B3|nr:flagellar basal body-associated protein FliL [Psychromonas sp. CNPT3]AGH82052.1 flagellar basal body-associated protein FliL [Psychromonas sp. CNPT3]